MAARKKLPKKTASNGNSTGESAPPSLATPEQENSPARSPHPVYPDRDKNGRILPGHPGPGRKAFRTTLRDMFIHVGEEVPKLDDNLMPTNTEGLSRLEIVIRSLYDDATKGSVSAREFIFDRIGGKVPVTIDTDWRQQIRGQVIGLLLSGQTTIELVRETFSETLFNELFAEYAQSESGSAGLSGVGPAAPQIIEGSSLPADSQHTQANPSAMDDFSAPASQARCSL